jgi:aryl-alcohol dehydrogenase-like predicted oxidoreductase
MDIHKTNDMPYRYLGKTGLKVSLLSFGTMLSDYSDEASKEWIEIAKAAFKAGVNYFDSSEGYGMGVGDKNLGIAIKEFG